MKTATRNILSRILPVLALATLSGCQNFATTAFQYERNTAFAETGEAASDPRKNETVTVRARIPKELLAKSITLAIDEDLGGQDGATTETEGGGLVLDVQEFQSRINEDAIRAQADREDIGEDLFGILAEAYLRQRLGAPAVNPAPAPPTE